MKFKILSLLLCLVSIKSAYSMNDATIANKLLIDAVLNDDKELTEILLQSGANPNYQEKEDKEGKESSDTPLIIATKRMNSDMVDLLLNNNANPNIKGKKGFTALMVIATSADSYHDVYTGEKIMNRNKIKIARSLLSKKASPNITNNKGFSAFMLAIYLADNFLVKLFLRNGADIESLNSRQGQIAVQALHNQQFPDQELEELIDRKLSIINRPPGGIALPVGQED